MPNTMRRHAGAVALYRCTMARGAPFTASTVRAINSSRDWVMTMMVTSSGINLSSMSLRTKSKSVCEAAGKPTSICLKPMRTSSLNRLILRSAFIGSNKAWLPSRKSVDNHKGAWVMVREGHWRSASAIGAKGAYFGRRVGNHVGLHEQLAAPGFPVGPRGSKTKKNEKSTTSPAALCARQRLVRGPGSGGSLGRARSSGHEREQTPAEH